MRAVKKSGGTDARVRVGARAGAKTGAKLEARANGGRGPSALERLEPRRLLTGTWSAISSVPTGAQMGVVLTNGSIMVHGGSGNASNSWYKLTPNSAGSYTGGSWSTLASSSVNRLYTATEVLQSGKVLVVGGEYSGASGASNDTNTGEIYTPSTNSWSNITNFPHTNFGDDPSALLPNGQVLTGYISGAQTYIYNPTSNAWTATGTKLRSDQSDEEAWVTLPDHSILSYDIFSSISSGTPHAQRYYPATGTWVDAGNPPAQLSAASVGYELGPGVLLPNGSVFYAGGTNATAYYNPSTNTWSAGPNMPNGYCMADAPAAMLPNGDVLMAMSPQGTSGSNGYNFPSPTYVYEFNPTAGSYTNVTPSVSGFTTGYGSYVYTMLVLPTGQVALMGDQSTIAVYTESGTALTAAAPVITGISYAGSTGVYTLSGTNLNGINEGAAYGDDNEMSSNYPLVRLTSASGVVTYSTTTNWSLTGVGQAAETVTFTLPTADTAGAYLIQSVANGVPSATSLAVLVNAATTATVGIQTSSNPANLDVVASGSVVGTFADSSFSSIYLVGDNSGDTLLVNLSNSAGSIITTVQAGTGTDTINVNQTSPTGPVTIAPSTGNDAVNVGTAGLSGAIAQFLAAQQIGMLTLGSGGAAMVPNTGAKKLLQTAGITTSGFGYLDLTNNDLIVHGGNLTTLSGLLLSGFNQTGGYWNGSGIVSSTAAADTTYTTALGMILNNNNGNLLYGSGTVMGLFDGQSPSLTDVLIKYTYYGDANLNGTVDGTDYGNLDNGFLSKATGWFNGDFDYNNTVNGTDYTLMDNTYNQQGATIAASVSAAVAASKTSTLSAGSYAGTVSSFLPENSKGPNKKQRNRPLLDL